MEVEYKGKLWTLDAVRTSIQNSDKAVISALMLLYSYQTTDEQMTGDARHQNGAGFNGADAPILTSFAQQYEQKGWLSPKQLELARKKLKKYSRQVLLYIEYLKTHKSQ